MMVDASICGLGQAAPNPIRCVRQVLPARELRKREVERMPDASRDTIEFKLERPRRSPRCADETILQTRGSPRRRDSAPLLQGRHARRRQLPRLRGRDRGRARARAVVLPRAAGRDGRAARTSARAAHSQKMVLELLALRHAARRAHAAIPSSTTGRDTLGVGKPRFAPRALSPTPTCRIRRSPSTSTPASSARAACAPAARCRSTTSSASRFAAITRRSCSTSTIRWARAPASPAASACRPVRPAR